MKSLKSVLLFWGKFISKTHTPLFPLPPFWEIGLECLRTLIYVLCEHARVFPLPQVSILSGRKRSHAGAYHNRARRASLAHATSPPSVIGLILNTHRINQQKNRENHTQSADNLYR